MGKVIRNVKVDWTWSGDNYAILGFNISITPIDGNPNNSAVQVAKINDGTLQTYTFNNITLDDTINYAIWVQAIYDGGDSDWVSATTLDDYGNIITKPFVVDDDGRATIETKASNIANQWKHGENPNMIDGSDIYAGSITADKLKLYGYLNVISPKGNSFSVDNTGNVKLSGDLTSFNYSETDNKGWSITSDGKAVLNDAVVRGSVMLPNAGITNFGDPLNSNINKNLVINTTFPTTTVPSNFYQSGSYTLSIDTFNKLHGYNTMKIISTTVGDAATNRWYLLSTKTNQAIGDKYTVSFWAKSLSGTNTTTLRAGNGGTSNNTAIVGNIPANWTKFTTTVTLTSVNTGAGAVAMIFWFSKADTIWISELKIESGDTATDYSPAPEDNLNNIRMWAGTDYYNRASAPFKVYQDGSVYATLGNFNGTFTGALDVGNIHITDTDPNTSPNGASILINSDADSKTVIKLQEEGGYIDTKFVFGDDVDQYLSIDNDNNSLNINNNGLCITQFINNVCTDSAFLKNLNKWGITGTAPTIDTTLKYNGYNCVKFNNSGLSSNRYDGIYQNVYMPITVGDIFTGSVWVYSDDISTIDVDAQMIVSFGNSSGASVGTYTPVSIKPTTNSVWQRFSCQSIPAPTGSALVQIYVKLNRNGKLWVACPQAQSGNTVSAWGVNQNEQKDIFIPNRIDGNYIEFHGNDYNIDIDSSNSFRLQSNTNSNTDFIFAKESVSNSVNVFMDGNLSVNNALNLGKLTMQKKTDGGNQGIDFIFS